MERALKCSSTHPSAPRDYGDALLVDELRTASAAVVEPNEGVTVSSALCTAECRGWLACLGLRLSACAFLLPSASGGLHTKKDPFASSVSRQKTS